jgi:hypothetical protein
MLLRPWTDLGTIKVEGQTFEVALKEFMSKAPENLLAIKDGIDSYHQCSAKAQYMSQLLVSI